MLTKNNPVSHSTLPAERHFLSLEHIFPVCLGKKWISDTPLWFFSGENLLNLKTLDPRFFFFLSVCDGQFYPWVCFSSNLTQSNFLLWNHSLGWCAHPHLLNFWDWPFKSKKDKPPLFRLFPMLSSHRWILVDYGKPNTNSQTIKDRLWQRSFLFSCYSCGFWAIAQNSLCLLKTERTS